MNEKRVNGDIIAERVQLIDENGKNVGITDLSKALEIAKDLEMDLVQLGDTGEIPICKILDFRKIEYEKKRKDKLNKKHKSPKNKEMRFGLNISSHYIQTKTKQINGFLSDGDRVKISVRYKNSRVHQSVNESLTDNLIKQVFENINVPYAIEGKANISNTDYSINLTPVVK